MARVAADVLPRSAMPSLGDTAAELRVVWETLRSIAARKPLRERRHAARDPVLVIPGFLASDASTWALRRYLRNRGFDAHPWELGVNRGPRSGLVAQLGRRIRAISRETGRPVQLVGWSLGGLLARCVADRNRRYVSRVVALGSPLSGDPGCSPLGRLFGSVCGRSTRHRGLRRLLRGSFAVPVVSIFSRSDGVVGWQASASAPGVSEAIEVESSHLGLVVNPSVLETVSSVLARPCVALETGSGRIAA